MKEVLTLPCSTFGCGLLHNIEYKRVSAFPKGTGISTLKRSLYMHMLYPSPTDKVSRGPYPIVVFISGGGWRTPQVFFRIPFLVPLARRGFLVVMADYRGCELFRCEDAVADVRSAVRYVRTHAVEYEGDPNNIFLMGESAGAHLSMLSAYGGEEFDDPEDNLDISAQVRGIIELYGPTDCEGQVSTLEFEALSDEEVMATHYATLAGAIPRKNYAERMKVLSPLYYVTSDTQCTPLLIAHGEEDRLVPISHAEAMYEKLIELNYPVEYFRLKNAGHGNWRFYDEVMMDKYAAFIEKFKKSELM